MELRELVEMQRLFDEARRTSFEWSESVTRSNSAPLIHNVLALAGEVGELANIVKKYDRGDFDFDVLLHELPDEVADIAIYLLKIAYQSGIDLEQAVVDKIRRNAQRFPAAEGRDTGPGVVES